MVDASLDEPDDADVSSDDLDDLDAALAALGIDVGRLPTVSPRHDPGADAGLDSNPGDPPPKGDRERSTDESDLVMSG